MNPPSTTVFFQARYEIEAPDFWWAAKRHAFRCEPTPSCSVEMQCLEDFEEGSGIISVHRTELVFSLRHEVSAEIYALIQRLDECPSMDTEGTLEQLTAPFPIPGYSRWFTYGWTTKKFWEEMVEIHRNFDRSAFRFVKSLFWRLGVHCGPSTMESEFSEFSYSLDARKFEWLPIRFDIHGQPYDPEPPNDKALQEALHFADGSDEPPLHHSLFREAWNRRSSESRVAIVMATAAMESAVKRLVSVLIPGTSWLMENVPSPPMHQILKSFFPTLPVRNGFAGRALAPPKYVLTEVQEIVKCRNKIAHGTGSEVPNDEVLGVWLTAIRDILWLTDYYSGCAWAIEHLSERFRNELESVAKKPTG